MTRARSTVILALVVLLTASLIPVVAEAQTEPQRRAWSPYDVRANIASLALARDGGTFLVGLLPPETCNPAHDDLQGTLPTEGSPCAYSNLVRFDHRGGPLWQNSSTPVTNTRHGIAIDGAGMSWVSIEPHGSSTQSTRANVYHSSLRDPNHNWTVTLQEVPQAVAKSADGTIIAVASGDLDAESWFRAYSQTSSLQNTWKAPGRLTSVAVSGDGQWMVAGGRATHEQNTSAVIHLFKPRTNAPVFTWEGPVGSESEVVAVAMSRDGRYFAAGLREGGVLFFENAGAATPRPGSPISLGSAPVRSIALADDASRAYVAHGEGLAAFERRSHAFFNIWSVEADGGYSEVATTGTGDLILAAGSGGLRAFPAAGGDPLFERAGSFTRVAMSRDGAQAVFARGSVVEGASLLPRLEFGFPSDDGFPTTAHPISPSIGAGREGSIDLMMRNSGIRGDRVSLEVPEQSFEASFAFEKASHDLAPGAAVTTRLIIRPFLEAAPGSYEVVASAVSLVSNERINVTVPFTIPQTIDFDMSVDGARERSILQNQEDRIRIHVDNRRSNDEVFVNLAVLQSPSSGAPWSVGGVPDGAVPIPRGVVSTFEFTVRAPPGTPNGTSNAIGIVLTGSDVPRITETVVFTVNPVVRVGLDAPQRLKLVPPGEHVVVAVTVENNGTVPTKYMLTYEMQAKNNRAWNVELPPLAFTGFNLSPGASQTFPVRIIPPTGATTEDTLVVSFIAESMHDNQFVQPARWTLDMYFPVQHRAAPPRGADYEAPAAGVAFLVLAGIGVALLARRRSA